MYLAFLLTSARLSRDVSLCRDVDQPLDLSIWRACYINKYIYALIHGIIES